MTAELERPRELRTDPEFRVTALAVMAANAKRTYEAARDDLAARLRRGHYQKAWHPDGGDSETDELGSVSMSKPDYEARCTDEPALVAWLREHDYHSLTTDTYEVTGSDTEVVDVLLAHAPHLVARVARMDPHALSDLLADSARHKAPRGPGGELLPGVVVERPQPRITVRPNDYAVKAVSELLASGRLTADGYLTRERP